MDMLIFERNTFLDVVLPEDAERVLVEPENRTPGVGFGRAGSLVVGEGGRGLCHFPKS